MALNAGSMDPKAKKAHELLCRRILGIVHASGGKGVHQSEIQQKVGRHVIDEALGDLLERGLIDVASNERGEPVRNRYALTLRGKHVIASGTMPKPAGPLPGLDDDDDEAEPMRSEKGDYVTDEFEPKPKGQRAPQRPTSPSKPASSKPRATRGKRGKSPLKTSAAPPAKPAKKPQGTLPA